MQHGNNFGHGNGKRWLLIALLVLCGFWLVNDAYDDGYRDALVRTGQIENARYFRDGPDFPWGLVILGGIAYIAWRKGVFDRFGGPGGPFAGSGERGVRPYGPGNGPAQTPGVPVSNQGVGMGFRGPRGIFEEWHREAHEAERARAQYQAPAVPTTPSAPPAATTDGPNPARAEQAGPATPPPPAPTPEYWDAMTRQPGAAEGTGTSGTPTATSQPPSSGSSV